MSTLQRLTWDELLVMCSTADLLNLSFGVATLSKCQYNSVNRMGSHNECTHWMYQYYVLYLAWWWLNEPKHVAEFLILITNICCVYWPNKLLYYWSFSRLNSKQVTYRKHVNIIDLHVHRLITDPQFWKAYDSVRRYNIELYVLLDE